MILNKTHISETIGGRLDSKFFNPKYMQIVKAISAVNHCCLSDIATFSSENWNQEDYFDTTFPYIEIGAIDTTTGKILNIVNIEKKIAPSRAKKIVRKNDIIVSTTRPNRGAISIINGDMYIASTGFAVIRDVSDYILRDYLFIILHLDSSLEQMMQRSSGGNYPAITEEELKKVLIPLPPIEIQQQIVDIYTTAQKAKQAKEEQANTLLDSIDDYLLSKLGINIPDIDDDRNSVVKISSLIGQRFDPDFNNMKYQAVYSAMGSSIYPIKTLSEICDTIFQGVGKNETDDNTYTLLKVKNIQRNNKIDFEDTEFVKSVPPSRLLQYNDIISPFIGEAIRQIKFSVFKEKTGNYTVDNNTGVIRVKQGVIADYIAEYLCSTLGAHQIKRLIGGGVPFLGAHGAGKILVNLPPLNLQEEIALTISKIRKQADEIQDECSRLMDSAKKQIEKMILG